MEIEILVVKLSGDLTFGTPKPGINYKKTITVMIVGNYRESNQIPVLQADQLVKVQICKN